MTKGSKDLSIPDAVDVQSGSIMITSGAVRVDSGLNVVVGSGVAIRSGLGVLISGQMVQQASGAWMRVNSGVGVLISGQMVQLQSGYVMKLASGQFVQINSISGQGVKVDSGVGVTVGSGLGVLISGQTVDLKSGVVVKTSGEVLKAQAPSALLAGYHIANAQSGGMELTSGVVVYVTVKSVSTSGDVWMGPPGIRSGAGFLLQPGEEKPVDIDNLNKVYVVSEISGVEVTWLAEVE